MKKFKKITSFLLSFLMVFCLLPEFNKSFAAEKKLPKISWAGLEHAPLLEGEDQGVYAFSSNYYGNVQYKLWISKVGENKWESAHDYSDAVYSEDPYFVNFNKKFEVGNYKASLWVKSAGKKAGKYHNANGSYDSYYAFSFACTKKGFVKTDKALNINKTELNPNEEISINGDGYNLKLHLYNPAENKWENNLTEYGKNLSYSIKTPGNYIVDTWVRNDLSSTNYDGWKLKAVTVKNDLNKVYEGSIKSIQNKKEINDWDIAALKMAGADVKSDALSRNGKSFIDNKKEDVKKNIEKYTISEYTKDLLSLSALGANVKNFEGINYVEEVKKRLTDEDNYPNQTAWGIIALESAGESYDKEAALKFLLGFKNKDGGFTYGEGFPSDVDLTAMAVEAMTMAGKNKDDKDVSESLSYIKNIVKTGAFPWGENVESLDQILMAAVCAKDDLKEYKINGHELIDEILLYSNDKGEFKHEKSDKSISDISTNQSLQALATYKNNKNMFLELNK